MVQAVPLTPGADEGKAREIPHLVPPTEEPSEGERAKVESGEPSPEERAKMAVEVHEKMGVAQAKGAEMKSVRERLDAIHAKHEKSVLTPEEKARARGVWFDAIEKIEELDAASGKVLKVTEYQPADDGGIESIEEEIASSDVEQQPARRKPPVSKIPPPPDAPPGDFGALQVVRTSVDIGSIDTGTLPPKARGTSSLRLVTPLPVETTPAGAVETGGELPLDAIREQMEAAAEVALDSKATPEQIEAAQDAVYRLAAANRRSAGDQRFALDQDAADLLAMLRRRISTGGEGPMKIGEDPTPAFEENAAAKSVGELAERFQDVGEFVEDGVIARANADRLKTKWLADYQPKDDERAAYESLRQQLLASRGIQLAKWARGQRTTLQEPESTAIGVDAAPESTRTRDGGGGSLEVTRDDRPTVPEAASFAGGGGPDTDIVPARAWGDGLTEIDVGPKMFAEGTASGEIAPPEGTAAGERRHSAEKSDREAERRFTEALLDANKLVREGDYTGAQIRIGQAVRDALHLADVSDAAKAGIGAAAGAAMERIEQAAAKARGVSVDKVRAGFTHIGLTTSTSLDSSSPPKEATRTETSGATLPDRTVPGDLVEETRTGTAPASVWGGGERANIGPATVNERIPIPGGRASGGEAQTHASVPDATRADATVAGSDGEATDIAIAPPSAWGGGETTHTDVATPDAWNAATLSDATRADRTVADAPEEPADERTVGADAAGAGLWRARNESLLRERLGGDAEILEAALTQERFTNSREVFGDPATARSIEALVRSLSGNAEHTQLRTEALDDLAERTGLDRSTLEGILTRRDALLREEAHAAVLNDTGERKRVLLKGAAYLLGAGGLAALGPLGFGIASGAALAYGAAGIAGVRSIETWLSGKLLGKKVDAKLAERQAVLGGDGTADEVRRMQNDLALEIARRKQEQINSVTGETMELGVLTLRYLAELRPDLSPEARDQIARGTRGLHVIMARSAAAEQQVAERSGFARFVERAGAVIGRVWQGGRTTEERALTTAVFGATGLLATIGQVTPLRRVLLGYAGGRVGETIVRLGLGKGERPVTAEEIAGVAPLTLSTPEGRGILDRAHAQLADPKFLKERPAEYQALFEAVNAHEERLIASVAGAAEVVADRNEAIEEAIAQKADGERRRALIVQTGRALGIAAGVFLPDVIAAMRGGVTEVAAAEVSTSGEEPVGTRADTAPAGEAAVEPPPAPEPVPEFHPEVFGEVKAQSGGGFVEGLKGAFGADPNARAQAIRIAQEAGVLEGRTTLRGIHLPEGASAKFFVDTRGIGADGVVNAADVKVEVSYGPGQPTEVIPLKEFANGPRFAYDFRPSSGAAGGLEAPVKGSGDQPILEELKKRKPGTGPFGADFWPPAEGGEAEVPSAPSGAETGGAGDGSSTPEIPRAVFGEPPVGPGGPVGEVPPAAGGGRTRDPFGGGEFDTRERASGGDTSGWKAVAARIERASGGVLKATEVTGTFRIGDRGPIISPEGLKMSAGDILTRAHPAGGDLAKVQSWFAERLAAAHPDWLSTKGAVNNTQELFRHLGADGGKSFIDYLKGNPGLSRAGK